MSPAQFLKIRIYFTLAVTLTIWGLLAWNHYHGGVPSHHLLADKDLPAISNWWGGLLLPLLTAFLLYRVQRRIFQNTTGSSESAKSFTVFLYGFGAALVFGAILATFFTLGYPDVCGYMILGLLPVAFFFPLYRAECLLGFVIGMTFTFGAILPTLFGLFLCLASAIFYLMLRPGILYMVSRVTLLRRISK